MVLESNHNWDNEPEDEDADEDEMMMEEEGRMGSPACGRGRSTDRIVGGQIAPPESFPWAASLQLSYGFHFCGASLIHPQVSLPNWNKLKHVQSRPLLELTNQYCAVQLVFLQWVITAAHCVAWGREVTRSRIQVGGHNLQGRMVTRRVAKIKIHLHYNSRTNNNDIALIKLSRPVRLSGRVRSREHKQKVIFQ